MELKLNSAWASDHLTANQIERRMHAILNDKSIRGEWFDISVHEAEALLLMLDDKQAFESSSDYVAMLTRAASCHPRAFS